MTTETKEKISKNISVPVIQLSMNDEFIAKFDSSTIAGMSVGIDASCIIKVCKGKRKSAGGYKWKYANGDERSLIMWENAVNSDDWLDIAEIVQRTGRNRNVIYSHIKTHNVPIVLNGRRRLIYYPALLEIFK